MIQKRLVGYVNEKEHAEFIRLLRQDGMTVVGWIRKAVREYIEQHKQRSSDGE